MIDSFLRKVETNVEDSPVEDSSVEVAVRAKNYKARRGEEVGLFLTTFNTNCDEPNSERGICPKLSSGSGWKLGPMRMR